MEWSLIQCRQRPSFIHCRSCLNKHANKTSNKWCVFQFIYSLDYDPFTRCRVTGWKFLLSVVRTWGFTLQFVCKLWYIWGICLLLVLTNDGLYRLYCFFCTNGISQFHLFYTAFAGMAKILIYPERSWNCFINLLINKTISRKQ